MPNPEPTEPGHGWRDIAAPVAIAAAAVLALAPVLGSYFIGDDWGLLAISRHLDSPLGFYLFDHSSSYFYRPNAMLLWWLSVAALGLNPAAHYGVNLGLHALNGVLLGALVTRGTRATWLGAAAGVVFAVHPAATGTALWLADRFDLAATAAVLWALLALERALAGKGGRGWVVLAALLAAGCKETAIVLPAVAAVRLAIARERPWRWRIETFAGVALPFAVMLAARHLVLRGVETTLHIDELAPAAVRGIGTWLMRSGEALLPFGLPGAWALALLVLALGAGAALVFRSDIRPRPIVTLALLGVALLILPAMVQWPVTQSVLSPPEALANPVNLRFYYLSLAGLLMFGTASFAAMPAPVARVGALALVLLALLHWLPTSRLRAADWAQASAGRERIIAGAAARAVERLTLRPGCSLHLLGAADGAGNFGGFADAAVKAQLARGAPALACVVLTERAPFYAITSEGAGCSDAGWTPLQPRRSGAQVLAAHRVGNLCYHYFADPGPDPAFDPDAHWFRLEGDRFVAIPWEQR